MLNRIVTTLFQLALLAPTVWMIRHIVKVELGEWREGHDGEYDGEGW